MLTWFCITVPLTLVLMDKQHKLLLIRSVEKSDVFKAALMTAYCIVGLLSIIFLIAYDKGLDAALTIAVISFLTGLGLFIPVIHSYRINNYLTTTDLYLRYMGIFLTTFGFIVFLVSLGNIL